MKKTIVAILIVGFAGVALAAALLFDLFLYARRPLTTEAEPQTLIVTAGQQFGNTAAALHRAGLIGHPLKFKVLARLKGYDTKIKSGEYVLSAAMTPTEILDILVKGRVRLYKLTIPEGYNQYQIAALVSENGLTSPDAFLQAATDPALLRSKGIDADSLEGYLFPDTYYFPHQTPPDTLISAMLQRFWAVFTPAFKKRADELNLSVHQVVTLASIIEKETGTAAERPLISSVFHNRLKKGMRLESDPTVIYGVKDFDGNLTRRHLTTRTPYNTYRVKGLPPGPIANPGREAIAAALYPAQTDYLFFVSRQDNTHHFSTNWNDHNKAVRRYQLRR